MAEYVNFECGRFAAADRSDPNERMALAYADINGYTAEEDAKGTAICRVWMFPKSDTKRLEKFKYLVDWRHDEYRGNRSVTELIKQVKSDLKSYFNDIILEKVFQAAYGRYKLEWLIAHGYSFDQLLENLQEELDKGAGTVKEALQIIENSPKYSVWDDEANFRVSEWEDDDCMRKLLTSEEYGLWLCK